MAVHAAINYGSFVILCVFSFRVSVGSLDPNVLGTCLLCGTSFDDYTSRCRCTHCRILVLICDHCQVCFIHILLESLNGNE